MPLNKVLIIGAGPSGLLLALLLSRADIPVTLLEQSTSLDTNPRASHYTAESCMEFDRAGILDEVRAQGFTPDGVSWRRLDENKTRLVQLRNVIDDQGGKGGEGGEGEGRYRMVCLPLHRLGRILERRLMEQPTAEIRYGCKVVEIGEDEGTGRAWVRVEREGDGGSEVVEGDYVVGCDGANSTVRRKLFGEMVFPGFTWDEQIVATNVYYDFGPYDYDDSQFFVHPEHW
jgi:2-polyprenyl-6-methoxyphenol hydroxylase-like FAD-dependent oxidoreductase